MAKIKDISVQIRGVSYKPTDLHDDLNNSSVMLLRANNIENDKINFNDVIYVDKSKVSSSQYLKIGDILICTSSGSKNLVGKSAIVDKEIIAAFGAFCKVIRPKNVYPYYLGHYFTSTKYRNIISELSAGANINNIRNEHIDLLEIPLPPLEIQKQIADNLDKVTRTIDICNAILEKLDLLVKSRFVEMFGDPVHNSLHLPILPMTDVCEIIDGDRGKNYPKQEEFYDDEYCLFLNAKNVTKNGFDFSDCMFITKEKDDSLRKGKLIRGDVVLTTRGTLGNLAFYTDVVPFENIRINSGMVILRMNKKIIDEVFFIEQFRMQVDDIKHSIASGSAQPQLPISTMNKINIIMPDLTEQIIFAAFVSQVEKSKSAVKQVLAKAETLKNALMQEYFG